MIHISTLNKTKKILIDGQLYNEDIEILHKELKDDELYTSFDITFIDVKSISYLIFKELNRIKNKSKIVTTDRSLWQYLTKFKIKNNYKNHFNDINHSSLYSIKEIAINGTTGSIENFLEDLYYRYGYDFRNYEKKYLRRRLEFVMKENHFKDFKLFEKTALIKNDLFDKIFSALSINTTKFFRNPLVFKYLRENILEQLETYSFIKIWCAGCSRGDEPYSVAIMLDEANLLDKTQIYATDFNETILTEARNGIFKKEKLSKIDENYIKSGGKLKIKNWFEINEDFIEVKQKIKDKILFFEHNLVTDGSINEFNLIFCRNVLIYFNVDLEEKVLETIDESLVRDSFLVLGDSEISNKRYNYKTIGNKKNKIYQKGYDDD